MLDHEPEQQSDQESAEKTGQTTVAIQTDMQSSEIEKMKEDLAKLRKDYCELLLKTTDQSATAGGVQEKHEVFGIDDFQGNDEKVRFLLDLLIGRSCLSFLNSSNHILLGTNPSLPSSNSCLR